MAEGRASNDFVFFRVNPNKLKMRVTINDSESVDLIRCPMDLIPVAGPPCMTDMLLILHFVGLMLGAGGGVGSTVVMRHALALPQEQGDIIRAVGPALSGCRLPGSS